MEKLLQVLLCVTILLLEQGIAQTNEDSFPGAPDPASVAVQYPPIFDEHVTLPEAIRRIPLYGAALLCKVSWGLLFPELCTVSNTAAPSAQPSSNPSQTPSLRPSGSPSSSLQPSGEPSVSFQPSSSVFPSQSPSSNPTVSMQPSLSVLPTSLPSESDQPSEAPIAFTQANLFAADNGTAAFLTPQGAADTPLNAVCGPVKTVLAHPTDVNICFVGGTNGGVWRTDTCTEPVPVWIPLTDNEASLSVRDMVFDDADPSGNTLVVALGGGSRGGILTTANALADSPQWTLLDSTNGLPAPLDVQSVYANGSLLLAAITSPIFQTTGGMYRSADSGATWTQTRSFRFGFQVVPDPADPDRFYGVGSNGFGAVSLLFSNDQGVTWTLTTSTPSPFVSGFGTEIRLDVSNGRVWLFGYDRVQATAAFSDDAGSNWTSMPVPTPNNLLFSGSISLLASPNDNDEVYIGGESQIDASFGPVDTGWIFRGNASTLQWEAMTGANTNSSSAPSSSSRDMSLRADGGLLEGNDGGPVVRSIPSTDTGDWFSLCGDTLSLFETISVAYEPKRQSVLFGSQSSGSILGSLGISGSYTSVAKDTGNFVMVDFESDTDNIYYYFGTPQLSSFFRATLSLMDNTTLTVEDIAGNIPNAGGRAIVGAGEINPANQLQFAVENGARQTGNESSPFFETSSIAFTSNRGATFQNVLTGVIDPNRGSRTKAMAWAADGSVLYISPGSEVSACTIDDNTLMTCSVTGIVEGRSAGTVQDLAVDPLNSTVLVAIAVRESARVDPIVWRSTNGGVDWTDVTVAGSPVDSADVGDAVTYMLSGPTTSVVLVGTSAGVYVEDNGIGNGWRLLALGLPNVRIVDMDYDTTDDILVVGTLGRGVWFLESASKALGSPAVFVDSRPPQRDIMKPFNIRRKA